MTPEEYEAELRARARLYAAMIAVTVGGLIGLLVVVALR